MSNQGTPTFTVYLTAMSLDLRLALNHKPRPILSYHKSRLKRHSTRPWIKNIQPPHHLEDIETLRKVESRRHIACYLPAHGLFV